MSSRLHSLDSLVGDPLYPHLKEHLIAATGLTYYVDKDIDLVRRVGRRLATTGVHDCASYLGLLRDPIRGPSELEAVVAEITIGETYFFRHPEHFDALRDRVLPDLISRNRGSRSLRVWCAGCADGPEPYSLAILLKQEMAQQLLGWKVSILGTDINRHCLARAREGRFEEWALRSASEELKRACFSKEEKYWSIATEYKEWVSFQYHNLVEDHFPSLVNNLSAFDLIICRNVMIYFGPDLMQRIVRQFYECLVPGAWLLVGPAEPNMISFTSFQTVNCPGVTFYQRAAESGQAQAAAVFMPAALPPSPAPASPVPSPPAVPRKEGIHPTLTEARYHADRGAWEDAARCCETLLKREPLDSSVHFFHGLVLEQMGRHVDAERSLRRAIYLDRKSVLAHYYLGLFLQAHGQAHGQSHSDPRQAVRSFENVLELLHPHRETEVFDDADGITAGELKKLTIMHLEILREST